MGEIKCKPKGEMAVREWIAAHLDELGFNIVRSGGAFPDLTLSDASGTEIRTEVEYKSANFVAHKHDPAGCDLVICWEHNGVLPVPVLELATGARYAKNQEPDHTEVRRRFDEGKPTRAEILTVLSGIPQQVTEFIVLMAEDLKIRSEWSRALCATRLPLSSAIAEINQHLNESGIVGVSFTPDELLRLIGK